jgi:hypothetical protein
VTEFARLISKSGPRPLPRRTRLADWRVGGFGGDDPDPGGTAKSTCVEPLCIRRIVPAMKIDVPFIVPVPAVGHNS